MNRYSKYDGLQAPWKNSTTVREGLLLRIRQSASNNTANSNETLFTEEKLAEQYYRMWLALPATATLQKIAQHPLLTKKSRATIDQQLQDQKVSQIKWSSIGTAVTLIIYSLTMSRTAGFRKFFNNQNSWMVTRGIKKTVAAYTIFLVWVASLTSSYQKQLPDDLEKAGLFKEYDILGKPSTT